MGDVDSYTITGLFLNVEYGFYVRAKNSHGVSNASASVFVQIRPAPASRRSPSKPKPAYRPTPRPSIHTLNHLPPGIQVKNWERGAQGQRVNHAGVGRPDVIAPQDLLDAVNIWGEVTPGIEVCFDQPGRLVFIDSVYPPIDPYALPAYQRQGLTCATIDSAGTVVLLRRDETSPEYAGFSLFLRGCEVRNWADVKFRQSPPGGEVISVTSIRKWLPASEKRYGYFKVTLWGREGWISGDYVYTRGDCGE